ncbi:MAG: hypothetical protein HZB11_00955 [Candidatus Yonathbacteria bacterium]|nr:hypothetical protein [Candidatus Yonathbacteria bacterium]
MSGSLRLKEAGIIKDVFPELFKIVYGTLKDNFPLDARYAPKLLELEAAEVLVSLVARGLVDYDPIWSCYNEHTATIFALEFVGWNKNLNGYTPPCDLIVADSALITQKK